MIPDRLVKEIEVWIANKRYGSLQINFHKGKIVNINRVESIKVESIRSPEKRVDLIATSGTSYS